MHDRDEIPYDEVSDLEKLQDEFRLFEANGRSSAVTIDGTCGVPYNIGLLLGIGPEGREREKEERDPQ